jgi:hypothetical protein
MKKKLSLLLIILSAIFQTSNAQTNPAIVTGFSINGDIRSGYRLNWAIANNEVINKFELEKSINGRDYTTIAVLFASEKRGTEHYVYSETITNTDKVMYRLRMLSKGQETYYSNIILFRGKQASDDQIKLIGNPVNNNLSLRFPENFKEPVDVKVYNLSGILVLNLKISDIDRNNTVIIPLNSTLSPGMYVAQVNNGINSQTLRFVKQ